MAVVFAAAVHATTDSLFAFLRFYNIYFNDMILCIDSTQIYRVLRTYVSISVPQAQYIRRGKKVYGHFPCLTFDPLNGQKV